MSQLRVEDPQGMEPITFSRMHRQQPQLLSIASFGNTQHPRLSSNSIGQTPSSTSSLSSPFSPNPPPSHSASINSGVRLPAGTTHADGLVTAGQYDPQQWSLLETSLGQGQMDLSPLANQYCTGTSLMTHTLGSGGTSKHFIHSKES